MVHGSADEGTRMLGGTGSGRTWWQRAVARGFDPLPPPHTPVTLVRSGEVRQDPETGLSSGGLGVLLPTYVARCDLTAHETALRHLLDALADVRDARPGLPVTIWLGMQYGPGEEAEAVDRLRTLTRACAVPVVGFALPGRGNSGRSTRRSGCPGGSATPAGCGPTTTSSSALAVSPGSSTASTSAAVSARSAPTSSLYPVRRPRRGRCTVSPASPCPRAPILRRPA